MLQSAPRRPSDRPPTGPTTFRPLALPDGPATARPHIRCLGEGLFACWVRHRLKYWHEAFIDSPHGSAHVATGFAAAPARRIGTRVGVGTWVCVGTQVHA